jgi:hypothetical protein
MATAQERIDLRTDTGHTPGSLTDTAIDRLFDRATVQYPSNTRARDAHVRVLLLRQMMIEAARQVDYKAGESSESLSQIRKALQDTLKYFEGVEKDAAAQTSDNTIVVSTVNLGVFADDNFTGLD